MSNYLTELEIAELIGITSSQVKTLNFPNRGAGNYDVKDCVQFYINLVKQNSSTEVEGVEYIADLLGVSERRVQQYVNEGMPRLGRGEYDVKVCIRWIVNKLKEENEALENLGSTPMQQERLKEIQLKNIDRRTKLRIVNGKYVSKEAVKLAWTTELSNIKKAFLSFPFVLGYALEGVIDSVDRREIIEKQVNEMLKDLADLKIDMNVTAEEQDFLNNLKSDES